MRFDTTNWKLLLDAGGDDSAEARDAMALLFEAYWPPVYAFVRRRGHSPADAEDLTQAYFTRFFEKRYAKDFRPAEGRFRTFLRASVAHFLANEWDRERAQKRGGGQRLLSLDVTEAEARYRREPADNVTPETVFERQWAAAMLDRCLRRLRASEEGRDGGGRFEKLKPFLVAESGAGYAGLARELGMGESAVRVAVHRLRKRFCAVLREEVARTVASEAEVDSEIRWLLSAVGGSREAP
jgi:RNA polymerase sigma factor (sigma-70 family)